MTGKRKLFKHRRRLELFQEQDGYCFWCKEPMVVPEQYPKGGGRLEPNTCTLDHLFNRHNPERRKFKNKRKVYVAACSHCNSKRGTTESMIRYPLSGAEA